MMAGKRAGVKAIKGVWRPAGHPEAPAITPGGSPVKRQFVIPADLDIRLSVLAKLRRVDRSELVSGLIAEACKGIRIDAGDVAA